MTHFFHDIIVKKRLLSVQEKKSFDNCASQTQLIAALKKGRVHSGFVAQLSNDFFS
jgi:hypothetical protein